MSKPARVDLDRVTTKAWHRFRGELADRIAGLEPGGVLQVEVEAAVDEPGSGCAPYVRCSRDDSSNVLGEVSGNRDLHPTYRLGKPARRRLAEIGWAKPAPEQGQPGYSAEVDQSSADRLAVMVVAALHEVFGVAHPAFLSGDVRIEDDPDLPHADTDVPQDEPLAVTPSGRRHLDQLVDEALVPVFGQVPIRDEDDDIPVVSGSAMVFVRTLPTAPVIKIWAEVVVEIGDLDRAGFEVAVLNRDHSFTKFALVDDRVVAQVHLPAAPFVPEHLRQTLAMMCGLADAVDDDLAVRVGGRRFFEPNDSPQAETETEADDESEAGCMHPALLTLHQLDAENPGSVKPALAARICQYDADLLLTLIRCEEEQQIAWRTSRDNAIDAGDPDGEAAICEHERAHAQRTTKLLRKALRRVVEKGKGSARR